MAITIAALCLLMPCATVATPLDQVIPVVIGESIAGIRLGMTLSEVRALGLELRREDGERANGIGWEAGPLLIIVDQLEKVTVVSLTLNMSRGIRIGKKKIPPNAKLKHIAKTLPDCTMERASGGRILTCRSKSGTLTFNDSFVINDVWVILP